MSQRPLLVCEEVDYAILFGQLQRYNILQIFAMAIMGIEEAGIRVFCVNCLCNCSVRLILNMRMGTLVLCSPVNNMTSFQLYMIREDMRHVTFSAVYDLDGEKQSTALS